MPTINLRPWREERNVAMQKRFFTNMGSAALLAAITVLGIGYYFDLQQDRQKKRNSYLQQEVSVLDQKIKEIRELREKRERLLERLNAISDLQGNRPVTVRIFDELVRVVPEGVNYNQLVRKESSVQVQGIADDNLEVSELMRNLDRSEWFGEPNLKKVGAEQERKSFDLSVQITAPKAEEQ